VLKKLLVPYPPELMDSYPVSSMVNSPKNEGKELIEAVVAKVWIPQLG